MAKTSKTTKRATASSGKKKGFLGRSFNLKSRKVQFVVSILVIAIVGAGYFTFKSFAATNVASYGAGNFTTYTDSSTGLPCGTKMGNATKYKDPAKNSAEVWKVNNWQCIRTTSPIYATQNERHSVCVLAKGSGDFEVMSGRRVNGVRQNGAFYQTLKINSPNGYSQACTTLTMGAFSAEYIVLISSAPSGTPIYVSTVSIDRDGVPATSPAPAPAK